MSRQAQSQASQNVQSGQQFATQANQNATQIGGWLTPTLQNQYENPTGFGQDWLDATKGEAGQIAGSENASNQNKLDLGAERTGNSAGFAAAADQGARDSQENLSNKILGIDSANAQEKSRQKSQALAGQEGMFGENLGAETGNLNAANSGVNTEANAGNSGWFQNLLGFMGAGSQAAVAGAKIHG